MSIHGFVDQNGQIQKYDYTDLENKPTIPAEVLIDDTLTEEGQAADAKAVGDALNNITIPVDPTLTQQGAAADAKAVGDAIANIEPGLSSAAKQALLEIFQHVAYIDEYGQDYYDALETALAGGRSYTITVNLTGCKSSNMATSIIEGQTYTATIIASSGYTLTGATATATMGGQTVTGFYNNGRISIPNVTGDLVITVAATSSVTSISAVFTQGSTTIYDTYTLDALRQYLVVTANYTDSTTAIVNDYTLSGDLESGTSVITATFGGKSDTFNVTVTSRIPAAYRQVEYLQSNGTQGIQTNIVPGDTRTIATFEFLSFILNKMNCLTGGFNANNQRYYPIMVSDDPNPELYFSTRENTWLWRTPAPTGKHTIDFNNASHQALYDGAVMATNAKLACTAAVWPICIFTRGRDTTETYPDNTCIAKIYSLRYEDNTTGNAVGIFIPCYRKSDNVGGMYDLVTEAFYTDILSGDPFAIGATHWEGEI